MDIVDITALTPITIPSNARDVRSLLIANDDIAVMNVLRKLIYLTYAS